MNLATLNAAHTIPDQLAFIAGPGGLPAIRVRNVHADALVSLHGAQVLSHRPHGGAADLLFVSEQAVYQHGKAIRGGVPVCWPWFGPDPQGLGRPAHGFARTRPWAVRRCAELPGGETLVELGLSDSAETRSLWPHAFDLTLTVTVGATLALALTTRNTGDTPFTLTQALHTYVALGDIGQARVLGLDGCRYIDNARGAGGAVRQQVGDVTVDAEVDRVYTDAPQVLAIADDALARTVTVRSEGSHTAVVWNPWVAIASGMADLPDAAYRRFVCVETANAADGAVTLPPGATHRLVAQLSARAY